MKVAFVQTAHLPSDERILYHQSVSLQSINAEVFIISTRTDEINTSHTVTFNDTGLPKKEIFKKINESLHRFHPEIIICDTPIAILGAIKYRKSEKCKIVYDITEWYPSKKNLQNHAFPIRITRAILLTLLSIFAASKTDGFIFGEYYKSRPFRFLFRRKKYCFSSYYPDLKYFNNTTVLPIDESFRLFYSGNLNQDKGYEQVIAVAEATAHANPEKRIFLTILTGTLPPIPHQSAYSNLVIAYRTYLPFEEFCVEIGRHHICLDLRRNDFENTHCLPIKLFYYMASGRPTIVSNLKAIKHEVPELSEFATAINPKDIDAAVEAIQGYIRQSDLYINHCKSARYYSESKYCWNKIAPHFLHFIQEL